MSLFSSLILSISVLMGGVSYDHKNTYDPLNDLEARQVFLFVDHSGSMLTPDCPGGETRWKFAGREIAHLADDWAPTMKSNLIFIPFSFNYDVCEGKDIRSFISRVKPKGETFLYDALKDVVETSFLNDRQQNKTHPVLIAILTDGFICDFDLVGEYITNLTTTMSDRREVQIVFIEVGQDTEGAEDLNYLDNKLVTKEEFGANYDIVSVVSFDELKKKGLEKCLKDAFNEAVSGEKSKENK